MAEKEKEEMARNTDTSPEKLEELSRDESYIIRSFVASNKSTPPEVREKLSGDVDFYVVMIANNNKIFET